MKQYIVSICLIVFFLVGCSNDSVSEVDSLESEKLVGTWIRLASDSAWVVYSYKKNNELYRATNTELSMRQFGSYKLEGDTMFFIDNPEDYKPVLYKIVNENLGGIRQDVLYLSDAETMKPYGFYMRVSDDVLRDLYGVAVKLDD